jgi:cyanoexosortase A
VILPRQSLQSLRFWYGCVGAQLVALHLILSWRIVGQSDQLIMSLLFWLSLGTLLARRQPQPAFSSNGLTSTLGAGLITLICLKSVSIIATESAYVRILPGLAGLAMAGLIVGFRLVHYWREGLLILTFMIPTGLANQGLGMAIGMQAQLSVAQFATFLLHYLGFTVVRDGITISLPGGAVSVEYGCTGGDLAILLWQLSVPLVLLFSIPKGYRCWIPIMIVLLTFLLSSIRVVIMALVVNAPEAFAYWHGHPGGQWFSMLAILLFSLYGLWLTERPMEESKP